MADLLNRANVDTAINTLLDDAQPNEAIQPSDHNGLLKNILDTLANGLSVTLRTNPETAGQDIEITSGDKVKFKNSTFFNSVVTDTLTADRTLTLPNFFSRRMTFLTILQAYGHRGAAAVAARTVRRDEQPEKHGLPSAPIPYAPSLGAA